MKKISLFAVFTASILLLGSVLMSAPTLNNDFAVGTNATGIQLISGVFSPITDSGVSLGSSALQFADMYLSGTLTVATVSATTLTVGGTLDVTGDVTLVGNTVLRRQVINVSSSTSRQAITATYVVLQGTGPLIAGSIQATTPILSTANVVAGTYVILENTSSSKGVSMATGTATCLIGPGLIYFDQYDTLGLVFDGSYWVVVSSVTGL